ncbi:FAD:protein FMN transferase [Treponema sp. HNW]|uniref:FAD:protein FMN transferase n=1 Tax=Treponema sp. HNW TaxID=3116654 RepID=UPI003D09D82C
MKIPVLSIPLIIFSLLFLSDCGQGSKAPSTEQAAVHKPPAQTAAQNGKAASGKQSVRLCASVPSVTDEYVPLFNTNVFIRTEDNALADAIEKDLSLLHKYFDAYRYYHGDNAAVLKNLKIVNEHIAAGKSINIDPPLAEIIKESIRIMELTDGYFNVFLEPVSHLYRSKFSSFPIENTDPAKDAIDFALTRVLNTQEAKKLLFLSGNTLSFLPHNGVFDYSLNFGAIAKGYAAKKIFDSYPGRTYMLSMGSSTIVSCGKTHRIGVASPHYKTLALIQIDLPGGMSLSTSGTLNNYYISASDSRTIRTHILDPRTGYSNDWWRAVIVISDNALVSDALSTALFNLNDEKRILSIITAVKQAYGCSIEACFVKDENREIKTLSLIMTEGFVPYIRNDYEGIGIGGQKIISASDSIQQEKP